MQNEKKDDPLLPFYMDHNIPQYLVLFSLNTLQKGSCPLSNMLYSTLSIMKIGKVGFAHVICQISIQYF